MAPVVETEAPTELPEGAPSRDFMKDNARRCLIIGAFLMPMLTFRILGQTTATTESGLTVSDLFFFFSLILLAASGRRRKLPPTRAWYIGVAFVIVGGLLATFHAQAWLQSLFVVARMAFVLLMWQWTIRHLADSEDRIHSIMSAYIFGCATSGFVAILQLEGHVLVGLGSLVNGRAGGLAHHPDDTGSFLALGMAFAVGMALQSRKRRPLYVLSAVLIGIGLVCTGSVSGMGSALLGTIVAIAFGNISAKQVATVVVVLVVAVIAGLSIQGASSGKSLNPLARFSAATGSTAGGHNSIGPRVGTWKGSWAGIVNSPILGHGLDVYSSVTYTDPYTNTPEPTHDFVLMAWYQGGALFLIGDLICIAEGIRRMRMRGRGPTQGILLAGSVSVILFALQAPMLYSRYFWFPFVLATAYPMLSGRTSRSQPGEGELLAGQPA